MIDPLINIRQALETALASLQPPLALVRENESYEPEVDVAYCEAYVMPATPNNATIGTGFYQEQGVFQVTLKYPAGYGTLDCATRAGQIRDLFARGATYTDGDVTVQIDRTPEIAKGELDDGRWRQDIRVRWHSDIFK
nr:phage tail terminator-like protein [uncultured Duganella sp.]